MASADQDLQGDSAALSSSTLHFGEMSIDMKGRLVYRRGRDLNFSSVYFGLLARLVERRPELVKTEDLCLISRSIPATLAKQMRRIQSKLGQTRSRPYIRIERSEGYRFV